MRRTTTIPSRTHSPWLVLVAFGFVFAAGCRSRPSAAAPARVPTASSAHAYARDVELLRSTDFVERSRASERLVAAGERAVPALGAAGDGTVRVLGTQEVGTTAPVLRTILGELSEEAVVRHLDSPHAVVRRETAGDLGRRGRWRAVPYLLPRMEDEDPQVRAASASALRRLTNRFFGFDADASLHARRRATERWREWWSIEGRVRAARDAGDGAG